jgi:hypothetical protein
MYNWIKLSKPEKPPFISSTSERLGSETFLNGPKRFLFSDAKGLLGTFLGSFLN